jgi:hypothetical protein
MNHVRGGLCILYAITRLQCELCSPTLQFYISRKQEKRHIPLHEYIDLAVRSICMRSLIIGIDRFDTVMERFRLAQYCSII